MPPALNTMQTPLPPLRWMLPVLALHAGFFFIGFFHWMLVAGLIFSVAFLRPRSEWPAWYVLFGSVSMLQYFIVSWLSFGSLGGIYAAQGPLLLLIGNWLHPLLAMAGVALAQKQGVRADNAHTLRGMSLLHVSAVLVAALFTLKDFWYIFSEGMVGDVRQGRIVDMQPIVLPDSVPVLVNFGLSHFMGAFVGIILVFPAALWLLVPKNHAGSKRIINSALIYLYLIPFALLLSNVVDADPEAGLATMLQILLLAAVVVFSFLHGWRGAALSVLTVSIMIAVYDHLHTGNGDILALQLFVAVMGSMALLFGASVDELKLKESALQADKGRLQKALAALADSTRRSMHSEELERKRLARELHDDMGQILTAMQAQLSVSQQPDGGADRRANTQSLERLTQKMSASLKSVVNALTPDELNQLGLYAAITYGSPAQLCEVSHIGYQVDLQGNSLLLDELDPLTNLAAYRIVQESVSNAVKYALCSHIQIRLRVGMRGEKIHLLLSIADDGIGLKSLGQIKHGFHSIRDRAMALNGVLHVHNLPGVRVHALLRQ
jgi:glucose-6-phosphate-specific signal transduction histidine kinase